MKDNTPGALASNLLRAGWEPLPSEVWHEVAEHLPQPWTEGQAAHDLRVHASEVRLKKRLRFSGRIYFRNRWGWPDRRVRSLLKAEQVWKDPRFAGERTTPVPAAYHSRTTPAVETQVEPSQAYQPRTTPVPAVSTRADKHSSQITDHKPPVSPPAGDADKAVDSVDKSKPVKRKRSTALTLEQIAAVEIPAVLKSLPGWSEAWAMYAEHRQELKAGKWQTPAQVGRMVTKLLKANADGMDVVFALVDSAANGYRGVFPKPPTGKPPADRDEPASIHEAWERIVAGVGSEHSHKCPGDLSGWWLWPRSRDATVHASMMEALCAATGQDHPPYAWQALRDARRRGPDSFDLNKIGRAWRPAYAAARKTARTAGGEQ